jgi:hypothetical protein
LKTHVAAWTIVSTHASNRCYFTLCITLCLSPSLRAASTPMMDMALRCGVLVFEESVIYESQLGFGESIHIGSQQSVMCRRYICKV